MHGTIRTGIIALACLSLAVLPTACSRTPEVAPMEQTPVEVDVGQRLLDPMTPKEIERYQPDIRMGACWAGDHVNVSIVNRAGRSIQVGPHNFAALSGGKVHPATAPGNRADFPATTLPPGAAASGRFFFPSLGNLTGSYIVFKKDPDVRPSRCRIRPEPPAGTETSTQKGEAGARASVPATDTPRNESESEDSRPLDPPRNNGE